MTRRDDPVLVTGASGTVGGEVARQLIAAEIPTRVLVRSAEKAAPFQGKAEIAIGDFADRASLARALEGARSALMASFDHPDQLALQGNLIAAAKHAGVGLVARVSGASADVDSQAALMRAHGAGDQQLAQSGLGYCLLRPHWFHQNFLGYCPGGVIRLPVGDGRVPFVDVRDIAAVAVKALTEPGHDGKAYGLLGPEALTHAEVAEILSEVTGRRFVFEDVSPAAYREMAIAEGMDATRADQLIEILERIRAGLSESESDDVERVLGRPPISFAQFARDYAAELVRQL